MGWSGMLPCLQFRKNVVNKGLGLRPVAGPIPHGGVVRKQLIVCNDPQPSQRIQLVCCGPIPLPFLDGTHNLRVHRPCALHPGLVSCHEKQCIVGRGQSLYGAWPHLPLGRAPGPRVETRADQVAGASASHRTSMAIRSAAMGARSLGSCSVQASTAAPRWSQ